MRSLYKHVCLKMTRHAVINIYFLLNAEYEYLGIICYILGVWFSYLATEKYEVCFFVLMTNG